MQLRRHSQFAGRALLVVFVSSASIVLLEVVQESGWIGALTESVLRLSLWSILGVFLIVDACRTFESKAIHRATILSVVSVTFMLFYGLILDIRFFDGWPFGSESNWKHIVGKIAAGCTLCGLAWFFFHVMKSLDSYQQEVAASHRRDAMLQSELAHVNRISAAGEMVTGIAHELNQPLTAIATTTATCRRILDEDNRHSQAQRLAGLLDVIESQSLRSGDIIRQLRRLLKKPQMGFARLDLNGCIGGVVKLIEPIAAQEGIEIEVIAAAQPLSVLGNDVQLQQVIFNIVQNSIEALKGTSSNPRRITISTKIQSDSIEVRIADTGPGVSAESENDLFTPFQTTKVDGMGMGLAIAKTIVEAHRGRIWAENHKNVDGLTLTFSLPIESTRNDGS